MDALKKKLLRVLVLSGLSGLGVVLAIAYFYGSVQSAQNILVPPEALGKIAFRDLDTATGRIETFRIDITNFATWQNHAQEETISREIFEPAYCAAYKLLRRDHIALAARGQNELAPIYTLLLRCRAGGQPMRVEM